MTPSMDSETATSSRWNTTGINLEDLTMDSNFILLLTSLLCAIIWTIYLIYYNSRIMGIIITHILARFVGRGIEVQVGSVSLSTLSGKLMFRNFIYITPDFSVRILDGWIIFKWWKSYEPKVMHEDMTKLDSRLDLVMNGMEFHIYNRSNLYSELEQKFGLDSLLLPTQKDRSIWKMVLQRLHQLGSWGTCAQRRHRRHRHNAAEADEEKAVIDVPDGEDEDRTEGIAHSMWHRWRDFLPVIKLELFSSRVVFGNRLLPTTLSLFAEELKLVYSSKPSHSPLDLYMHTLKGHGEGFKILLSPSPKYTGPTDEPPRFMGEGFVVLSSSSVQVYYYWDEPGVVPTSSEGSNLEAQKEDGDEDSPPHGTDTLPVWGIDLKCGKNTDISYGPWADRQRDQLMKFFFPSSYGTQTPTPPLCAGQKRQPAAFEFHISLLEQSTIDILFSKQKETQAVHVQVGAGTYLDMTIPWVIEANGYTTKINGQFLHLDSTTSLLFRKILECETLEFDVSMHTPLCWNHEQHWKTTFTACKATAHLIFAHKVFFQDMIEDWSSSGKSCWATPNKPDILHFVPYTWVLECILKQFELILPCSQHNWIDCSSQIPENVEAGVCGDLLDFSLTMPFNEFLPKTVPLKMWLQGENLTLSSYLPEIYTSHDVVLALHKSAKLIGRDGTPFVPEEKVHRWRHFCLAENGWVDMGWVPIAALSMTFTYHPMPHVDPQHYFSLSTPEQEEYLLSPIRAPATNLGVEGSFVQGKESEKFDPSTLDPDVFDVEFEIGPSNFCLYGTLFRALWYIKENYFGESQVFQDMEDSWKNKGSHAEYEGEEELLGKKSKSKLSTFERVSSEQSSSQFDPRKFRPFTVTVCVIMHDIQGALLTECTPQGPPCPLLSMEQLVVELHKSYHETKIQVNLSPVIMQAWDSIKRPQPHAHLQQGLMLLSALQFRGHALFSDEGRKLEEETLEYGWLVEVQLGQIIGRLSLPQLQQVIFGLNSMVFLAMDRENSLRPVPLKMQCYHGKPQDDCPESLPDCPPCPTSDEIKYAMTRVTIDIIDVAIVEKATAIKLQVYPVRLATCNLHGPKIRSGVTLLTNAVQILQYIAPCPEQTRPSASDMKFVELLGPIPSLTDITCVLLMITFLPSGSKGGNTWLEVSRVSLGPIVLDAALSSSLFGTRDMQKLQCGFLEKHDRRSHRLWFLWLTKDAPSTSKDSELVGKCGCVGGCAFFGHNTNGPTFFKPSDQDFTSGTNVAQYRVNAVKEDLGYGQSLLQPNQLVFNPHVIVSSGESPSQEEDSEFINFIYPPQEVEGSPPRPQFSSQMSLPAGIGSQNPTVVTPLNSQAISQWDATIARTTSLGSESDPSYFSAREQIFSSDTDARSGSLTSRMDPYVSASNIPFEVRNQVQTIPPQRGLKQSSSRSLYKNHMQRRSSRDILPSKQAKSGKEEEGGSSSSASTVSSTSFLSAVSTADDLNLVELHNQVNKQITDSPLLMSTYTTHLAQVQCKFWTPKMPVHLGGSSGVYLISAQQKEHGPCKGDLIPQFLLLTSGFTGVRIKPHCMRPDDSSPESPLPSRTPSHLHVWDIPIFSWKDRTFHHQKDNPEDMGHDGDIGLAGDDCVERTTIVLKVKSAVDITTSPLALESLQRFLEALTPSLTECHPWAVLDLVHMHCSRVVESRNVLIQRENNWVQLMGTLRQQQQKHTEVVGKGIKKGQTSPPESKSFSVLDAHEERRVSQVQGLVVVPKINVSVLQASLVETVTTFSSLDNFQDLLCVSVLAVSITDTKLQFYSGEKTLLMLRAIPYPEGASRTPHKSKHKSNSLDRGIHEPLLLETPVRQQEEFLGSIRVASVHSQLRRLTNNSSILNEAVITAIPVSRSEVNFSYEYDALYRTKLMASNEEKLSQFDETLREALGYIMCEAGFEGLHIEVVKQKNVLNDIDDSASQVLRIETEAPSHSAKKSTASPNPVGGSQGASPVGSSESPTLVSGNTTNPSAKTRGTPTLTNEALDTGTQHPHKGDFVSCILSVKSTWFNFAAPPRSPVNVSKKMDFNKLDWNLLSTASPAISAWLNPLDRHSIALYTVIYGWQTRRNSIMACLMTQALEGQGLHLSKKSKYNLVSLISKTLQEDPCCQLCTVLRRYTVNVPLAEVENNIQPQLLPTLDTLKKGIVVLTRQWKNFLYMPLAWEQTFRIAKMRKLQLYPTIHDSPIFALGVDPKVLDSPKSELDVTDEHAQLLLAESGSLFKHKEPEDIKASDPLESPGSDAKVRPSLPHFGPKLSRATISGPLGYSRLSIESNSLHDSVSMESQNQSDNELPDDTLYSWLARQQQQQHQQQQGASAAEQGGLQDVPWNTVTSNHSTKGGESDGEASEKLPAAAAPLLQVVDPHIVFEILLTYLGVGQQQVSEGALAQLGSNISVTCTLDSIRADIAEALSREKGGTAKKSASFLLEIPNDMPSFICEGISLKVEAKKVTEKSPSLPAKVPKAVFYVSQHQLKNATSTVLHFSATLKSISQQVNMPLLRLVLQIAGMYQNVVYMQKDLKHKRASVYGPHHQKNSSSGSGATQVESCPYGDTIDSAVTAVWREAEEMPHSNGYETFKSGTYKGRPSRGEGRGISLSPLMEEAIQTVPVCWKTLYHLLDLYAITPETKTITNRIGVMSEGLDASVKLKKRIDVKLAPPLKGIGSKSKASYAKDAVDSAEKEQLTPETQVVETKDLGRSIAALGSQEKVRLVVFGVVCIEQVRVLATLSGLKLEAQMNGLNAALSHKEMNHGPKLRHSIIESSLTTHVTNTFIVLLEGIPPSLQTVVKVGIGKVESLYSLRRHTVPKTIGIGKKERNSILMNLASIDIDIPQHPVILHGMMTRSSKQISSTLQELRVKRATNRLARGMTMEDIDLSNLCIPEPVETPPVSQGFLKPIVVHFSIILQALKIQAALLPSLQAQYEMTKVTSVGVTGSKANFTVDLAQHTLSFATKVQVRDSNLPPSASISLPQVHVSAEYVQDSPPEGEQILGDVKYHRGNYLSTHAEIGILEHNLTTDVLNHLVFVQKVFMKEINEVLQKMTAGDRPVSFWNGEGKEVSRHRILFSLVLRIKGIQVTATTPTSSAVRLETGSVELYLSNRVKNSDSVRLFCRAKVEVNLSLGQLIRNVFFEEAEPEFQQFAFFKTRIGLRNMFQDELGSKSAKELGGRDVVLITLNRPLIYIQPIAVDRAILVWLNYRNAYEYWTEQRASLNKEVLTATQQVMEKMPNLAQLNPPSSSLFVQLNVDDMGICLPLNQRSTGAPTPFVPGRFLDVEPRGGVIVTLESTSISALSSGSLASKGMFSGLCIRFADELEVNYDDWKPNLNDPNNMNLCVVSEGTYEVCSHTVTQQCSPTDNAKWVLNVSWKMDGVDIHVDTDIGKELSALARTLTALTEVVEEEPEPTGPGFDSDDTDHIGELPTSEESVFSQKQRGLNDTLPSFIFDPKIDSRQRSKLLENEMNEQAKVVNDLRMLGASPAVMDPEVKRLRELEAVMFNDFRRDFINKLRRQSVRAPSIKDKLGLSTRHNSKSKSFVLPSTSSSFDPNRRHSISPIRSGETSSSSSPSQERSQGVPKISVHKSLSSSLRRMHSQPGSACSSGHATEHEFDDEDDSEEGLGSLSEGSSPKLSPSQRRWTSHQQPCSRQSSDDCSGHMASVHSFGGQKVVAEPNIDFELDVKVLINSGKCILHSKDPTREEDVKKLKKDPSWTGDLSSPTMTNRLRKDAARHNVSLSRLKQNPFSFTPQVTDSTEFLIPGLDVKLHYESRTESEEQSAGSGNEESSALGSGARKSGLSSSLVSNKKACVFAWVSLHSVPEEILISPHILLFLEKTLEPIPYTIPETKTPTGPTPESTFNLETSQESVGLSAGSYVYASFPVDVMVFFHMQPSTFRFSCLPVSKVECLLKLPSLDLVFSSKRAEDELNRGGGKQQQLNDTQSASGGLSVTGCLADFSLYIFHPYGGSKKTALQDSSMNESSPGQPADRKDSLSVQVEFVKFHISRSRKFNSPKAEGKTNTAIVRFSTMVDIGSASFKYDMRRLTEILAFPKAWYRRSIVRRMFLGDMTTTAREDSSVATSRDSGASASSIGVKYEGKACQRSDEPLPNAQYLSTRRGTAKGMSLFLPITPEAGGNRATAAPAWETLVLFAVNFTKLNVQMNMSNVMGNVIWLTRGFCAEGRLSIGSTGHKNMHLGLGLQSSNLEAKGGIVGGNIDLSQIDTYLKIREDPGTTPDHILGLKLEALEARLDCMGTSILMGRVSSLQARVNDEWRLEAVSSPAPTDRPAAIHLYGDLSWDQLQLLFTQSTATDLMRMYGKLEEFFSQQLHSGRRVFSSLQGGGLSRSSSRASHLPPRHPRRKTTDVGRESMGHHRHWQPALHLVSGLKLPTLRDALPQKFTVLGGTVEMRGKHISLACFHGINLRSKSWALFSLKDPFISFMTEAQDLQCDDPKAVHIVQHLAFSLGGQEQAIHGNMATVCRISRSVMFPPQFKTLHEWFHYAFATSELDDVDRFPYFGDEEKRSSMKLQDNNHTTEVIFAFPGLQMDLKTEHHQAGKEPSIDDAKALVNCSFVTVFNNHIYVTVDAEGLFFLHDVVTSYVKDSDKQQQGNVESPSQSPGETEREKGRKKSTRVSDPIEILQKDYREFLCKTWHLEPTVRLMSWGGKHIEPYGVDYILQKLGFAHARTTIPKWLQRGFMDPLDKGLSLLALNLLFALREESHKQASPSSLP